jgi:hypothetical protein
MTKTLNRPRLTLDDVQPNTLYREKEVLEIMNISDATLYKMQRARVFVPDVRNGSSPMSPRRWWGKTILKYYNKGGAR